MNLYSGENSCCWWMCHPIQNLTNTIQMCRLYRFARHKLTQTQLIVLFCLYLFFYVSDKYRTKVENNTKKWATIRLQFLFCSEKIWFNCFDLVVSQPKINDAIQCIEPSATKTVYGIRIHPYNFLRDNKEHRSTERRFMLDPFWKESNLPNHHRSQTKSWNLRLW